MRTALYLITSVLFFFLSLAFIAVFPNKVLAEGTAFPCNRPNQLGIGVPTNNYQCAYTSNGCRNTAFTHYVYTTKGSTGAPGSGDPNNQYDQPWCDYNCAAPANVACQSSSSGGNQSSGGTNSSGSSSGGSCTDPGGNSLPSSMPGGDQTCILSSKGVGLLGSITNLLNSNGFHASGCTQGQLLTKWCNDIDQSGCQSTKASCSSLNNSSSGSNSGGNNAPSNPGNPNSTVNPASSGTSNTVTTQVGNPAATSGNCNGRYSLGNPIGNFGDPNCNFSKDGLFQILQQIDPGNANFWYYSVVPCESSYNPNAYNPYAKDPAGAFGLFQMGRGRNGQYDHGDVEWHSQPGNAVSYKNIVLGGSFAYWACAQ